MATPTLKKPHSPNRIKHHTTRARIKREVIEGVRKGLSPNEAFELVGLSGHYFTLWKRWALEDLDDGFTGTYLQEFIFDIVKEDRKLLVKLNEKMWDKVDEGDARIMMYLADNRFGYANKRKNTVELDTKKDTGIEINIVNMTGVDADKEDPIEVDYEVNDGSSRDDSNPTEMD